MMTHKNISNTLDRIAKLATQAMNASYVAARSDESNSGVAQFSMPAKVETESLSCRCGSYLTC